MSKKNPSRNRIMALQLHGFPGIKLAASKCCQKLNKSSAHHSSVYENICKPGCVLCSQQVQHDDHWQVMRSSCYRAKSCWENLHSGLHFNAILAFWTLLVTFLQNNYTHNMTSLPYNPPHSFSLVWVVEDESLFGPWPVSKLLVWSLCCVHFLL